MLPRQGGELAEYRGNRVLQKKGASYPESAVLGAREVSVEGTCGGHVSPGAASEHVCPRAAPVVTLGQDSTQAQALGVLVSQPAVSRSADGVSRPFPAGAVTVTQGEAELLLPSGNVSRHNVGSFRRLHCASRPRLPAARNTGSGGR